MTISTNIHLLRPVFTIQGYTELKVAFRRGLTGKKLSQILCFLRLCRSQFRALSNYLQLKQTIFFHFPWFCFRNLHAGSMVPDFACFALFLAHDHESVKKMAAMLQVPRDFPLVRCLGSAKAVQCPRPGPKIGDKSQQIPRYSPYVPGVNPPGWPLISA